MILLLSYFTIVVEEMEFDVKAEVTVAVVIDESALAIFEHEVEGLVFVYSIVEDWLGFCSIEG